MQIYLRSGDGRKTSLASPAMSGRLPVPDICESWGLEQWFCHRMRNKNRCMSLGQGVDSCWHHWLSVLTWCTSVPTVADAVVTPGRDLLLRRLEQDLVGPHASDETLITGRPSDVYLTGILWPLDEKIGDEESERLDSGADADDETEGAGEEVPLTGQQRPCSA